MGLSGAIVKLIKDIVHIYEENYYLFLFSLTVVIRYIDKVYIISQNFYRVLVSAYTVFQPVLLIKSRKKYAFEFNSRAC